MCRQAGDGQQDGSINPPPAKKYVNLFPDLIIPRTLNFNPDTMGPRIARVADRDSLPLAWRARLVPTFAKTERNRDCIQ